MSFTSLPHGLATELRELGPLVDFLQRSRWAQRAGEPGISDFVLGNPHDPVLPGSPARWNESCHRRRATGMPTR
ncbi:MAG: hypothetical protein R2848_02785 [Thermomicrobiales bacterium]